MKENVQMSIKEAERLSLMKQVDNKSVTLRRAAEELGLSVRQIKRVRKRYLTEGAEGLISKKRGKESNRKTSAKRRNKILSLIRKKYIDFGPTLAA